MNSGLWGQFFALLHRGTPDVLNSQLFANAN